MQRGSGLLDELRAAIRTRHYSIRTEQPYLDWIRRFILFHHKRHPREKGETEVGAFLSYLAVEREVAASTQSQAPNALVFLYAQVLGRSLADLGGMVRAKKAVRLPVVLTVSEVAALLQALSGVHWLVECLQYGSGLRLLESVRLLTKDIDFAYCVIIVRDGRGSRDRVVTLPDELVVPLERHLGAVRTTHERDLQAGFGAVYLPHALARKYPNAAHGWA